MLLTIFLILLAICAAAIAVMALFHYPIRSYFGLALICFLVVTLIMGCWNAAIANRASSDAQDLITTYNDLVLYQDTVSYSGNEYVRFDFYTKVQEYNEAYNDYLAICENGWVNCWYKADNISNISLIDFSLNYE